MPPKRHHFIPILHLKHFVGVVPKGQIWTYDKRSGQIRSSLPENTAVQAHFYSVEGDDGMMDTRLEEHLALMESKAAPVYDVLLNGRIPAKGTQARVDFATFLALMYVRTPAMRRMSAEMLGRELQILAYAYAENEKAFDTMNRRAEQDGARPLNDEEKERVRREFLEPSGKYVMQIAKERTLQVLTVADNLAPIFYNMKWSILEVTNGFVVTTDNPLIRDVNPKTRHPIYGDQGFMNKTAQVIFPLSPRKVMFMSWLQDALESAAIDRRRVDGLNQALAANSDQFLYAHMHDKSIVKLAEKHKESRPTMTTKGYGPKEFAAIEVPRRMRSK